MEKFDNLTALAEKYGLSDITLDEINEEVAAVRRLQKIIVDTLLVVIDQINYFNLLNFKLAKRVV